MENFSEILKMQIEKRDLRLERLCEGLCSVSLLTRICNGERKANKWLRERLMERMRLSDTRNECFLFSDEYKQWEMRQQIVKKINCEQFDKAKEILQRYQKEVSTEEPLQQQFCLVMESYMMSDEKTEKGSVLASALMLTVPNIGGKKFSELLLSEVELDLVLEYVRHVHPERLWDATESVIAYIKHEIPDSYIRAKIFPKAVYYQYLASKTQKNVKDKQLFKHCNEAIECLRGTQRLYYLWELLEMRADLCNRLVGEKNISETIQSIQKENTLWMMTIEEIYRGCKRKPGTKNSCYLYVQRNTFCINDIIQKRRTMLDMTKKALGEGICSEKTIARVEKGNKMQLAIVKEISARLGLSGEYQKTDVITSNPEAFWITRLLAKMSNDKNYEMQEKQLQLLKTMIPMDEPINRQYVQRFQTMLAYRTKKISKDSALCELKEALEYTIPLHTVLDKKELFLTNGEKACIINMATILGNDTINIYHELLWKVARKYEENDKITENISVYEFIMSHIASVLGNVGRYQDSDEISEKIIKENLLIGRMGNIADAIYNLAYNYKAQNPSQYDKEVWRDGVKRSMVLYHIEKCYNLEEILRKKIEK